MKQTINNHTLVENPDMRQTMCKHIKRDKTCDISGKLCKDVMYCGEIIPFSYRQETDDARLKQILYVNMLERAEMCSNISYLPSKCDFYCDKHNKRCIDVINCSEDCLLPLSPVCPVCGKLVQEKKPDYLMIRTTNGFKVQLFHKDCVQSKP